MDDATVGIIGLTTAYGVGIIIGFFYGKIITKRYYEKKMKELSK